MEETMKSQVAIRCAKAAILISSLKSNGNWSLNSTNNEEDQKAGREMMKRAVEELKIELVKARAMNRKMRLCSLMELLLQIAILISLWSLCLIFVFNSL